MDITVEGPESFANDSYSQLLERTLVDMGITTSIEKVKMIIRPSEPLFIISIRTRKAGGSRMVSEDRHYRGEGGRDVPDHQR